MKHILAIILSVLFAVPAFAQNAATLVKQGLELNNAGNYAGAIAKYKAALTAEPDNISANYQMAFALNVLGKGPEAIPYLQKVVAQPGASAKMLSGAYSLMGGIYDKTGQAKKSIENYQRAINADTTDAGLHYNLGLAYFRIKQFADAERCAIEALGIDPKHANSWRLYALVTFHQNKRAPALLGLSTFLWLAPNDIHAAEAYGNMQSIIKGGVLKAQPGVAPVNAYHKALNQAITRAVDEEAKRRYLVAVDQLSQQLQAIFAAVGQLADNQKGNDFFGQLAARYSKLAQSPNMPAFGHYIRQNPDKAAAEWTKLHPQQLAALQEYMKNF